MKELHLRRTAANRAFFCEKEKEKAKEAATTKAKAKVRKERAKAKESVARLTKDLITKLSPNSDIVTLKLPQDALSALAPNGIFAPTQRRDSNSELSKLGRGVSNMPTMTMKKKKAKNRLAKRSLKKPLKTMSSMTLMRSSRPRVLQCLHG